VAFLGILVVALFGCNEVAFRDFRHLWVVKVALI